MQMQSALAKKSGINGLTQAVVALRVAMFQDTANVVVIATV